MHEVISKSVVTILTRNQIYRY